MSSTQTAESDFAHLEAMLGSLNQLLSDEYAALKAGDIENLELLLEQKDELLKNIEGISQRVEPSLAVLQTKHANNEQLPENVKRVFDSLLSCQAQNQINGSSIEANRKFSATLLDLLTARESEDPTYTAKGKFFTPDKLGNLSEEA